MGGGGSEGRERDGIGCTEVLADKGGEKGKEKTGRADMGKCWEKREREETTRSFCCKKTSYFHFFPLPPHPPRLI